MDTQTAVRGWSLYYLDVASCRVSASRVFPGSPPTRGAHAGLPHWSLLALVVTGLVVVAGSVSLSRTRWPGAPRRTISGVLVGVVVVMVGTIGLVESRSNRSGQRPVPTGGIRC